ncbi:MAG: hypothetical protein ABII22_04975 [Candidatus Micrarchaeota archaeon]
MNLNRLLLFSSVFVLLFLFSENLPQKYFQLDVGNYWTYYFNAGYGEHNEIDISVDFSGTPTSGEYTTTITGVENINGTNYYIMKVMDRHTYVTIKGSRVIFLKDVVGNNSYFFNPPKTFIDFGSNSWDWKGTYDSIDCAGHGQFLGFVQIPTFAGSFTCLKFFDITDCSNGNSIVQEWWLFEDIGSVYSRRILHVPGNQDMIMISSVLKYGQIQP